MLGLISSQILGPSLPTGLVAYFDSSVPGSLWQDVAKTTPATANGHPVRCWRNLVTSSGIPDATMTTAGMIPSLLTAGDGGLPAVSFGNGQVLNFGNAAAGQFGAANGFTVVVQCRPSSGHSSILVSRTAPSGQCSGRNSLILMSIGLVGRSNYLCNYNAFNGLNEVTYDQPNTLIMSSAPQSESNLLFPKTPGVGRHVTFWDNSMVPYYCQPTSDSPNVWQDSPWVIGGWSDGAISARCPYQAVMVFDHPFIHAEARKVARYLSKFGGAIASDRSVRVIVIGDSISANAGASWNNNGYEAQWNKLYAVGNRPHFCSLGESGYTAYQLSRMLSRFTSLYDSSYDHNVAIVFCGTNDVWIDGASASAVVGYRSTLITGLKDVGFRVGDVTMLPRGPGGTDSAELAREAIRQEINARTIAGETGAHVVIPVGGDANYGQYGQSADSAKYDAMRTHPKDAGHGVIAQYVKTGVDALIAM